MTKKSNEFLKLDKVYEATLKLGYVSTTGDPEGEIMQYNSVPYTKNGNIYGVDYHVGAAVIYYNKEILDAAGVKYKQYVHSGREIKLNV